MEETIDRETCWKLADELNAQSWGYVEIRVGTTKFNRVIWHPREGTGLYERQIKAALALAELHKLKIHINEKPLSVIFTREEK